MQSSRNDRSLYTDVVLFFFSFFSKTSASASSSSPHPYPLNKFPRGFIFYHASSTDFEEKMEGLWTSYNNRHQSPKS